MQKAVGSYNTGKAQVRGVVSLAWQATSGPGVTKRPAFKISLLINAMESQAQPGPSMKGTV